jgi:hypothetical protein
MLPSKKSKDKDNTKKENHSWINHLGKPKYFNTKSPFHLTKTYFTTIPFKHSIEKKQLSTKMLASHSIQNK